MELSPLRPLIPVTTQHAHTHSSASALSASLHIQQNQTEAPLPTEDGEIDRNDFEGLFLSPPVPSHPLGLPDAVSHAFMHAFADIQRPLFPITLHIFNDAIPASNYLHSDRLSPSLRSMLTHNHLLQRCQHRFTFYNTKQRHPCRQEMARSIGAISKGYS